jgi:hypothetical protein
MLEQASEQVTRFGGHRGGNILEFYTEEFRPEPSPVEVFRQHVVQWFFAAKHLRIFEVRNLTDTPREEDIESHRLVSSALITFGEFATIFAKANKQALNLESLGLTVESIEVETRLLRDSFKMFHEETMTIAEANQLLEEAFA